MPYDCGNFLETYMPSHGRLRYRTLERLKQRIGKLRSAIRSLESSTKLNKLAEQVRDASVTVIKLKLSIIADQPAFLMGMMDHPQNDALER